MANAATPRPERGRVLEYEPSPQTALGTTDEARAANSAGMIALIADQERHLQLEAGVHSLPAALQSEIDRLREQLQKQNADHQVQISDAETRGRGAGHAAAKRENEASLDAGMDRVAGLLSALEIQTREYLKRVERDVVILALDISYRVMQHEAQIDRLFLSGAVHMALAAMRETGEIRLLVPEPDIAAWQILVSAVVAKNPIYENQRLVVEGDPGMTAGQCVCKLAAGVLDLGARSQLGEIERSFESILLRRHAAGEGESALKAEDREAGQASVAVSREPLG